MKRKADFEPEEDLEIVKRRRLETLNYFSLLPDGLVELVLSEIYRTTYTDYEGVEVEVFNASLRLVSHQFRRVIDDSVPCFALLKLLKSEYQRVSNSDGSIDSNKTSPWLTHSEVSMILSKRQIDLNEPLPEPRLMPLTALQIVASTLAFECQNRRPNIEIIYTVAASIVFVQTLEGDSPLNGKKIIVQQRILEGNNPRLITRFCVTDHETASQLGVAINAQHDYDEYIDESITRHERIFLFLEQYHSELRGWSSDVFAGSYKEETGESQVFLMDMQYRRGKALWDQFPTLPPPIYRALTQQSDNTVVLLNSLRNVIEMFKLNVIFKSHTSAMMRKLFGGTIESQSIEHLITDIKIIRRSFEEIPALFESFSTNNLLRHQAERSNNFVRATFKATNYGITGRQRLLRLQRDIGLPVPLTPVDFQFILQILIGNISEDLEESLSMGFVFGVCHNEVRWQNETALVQILDLKKLIVPGKEEKYRVVLSDGINYMHGIIPSQLSHYVHDGTIALQSLIGITQYTICNLNNRKLLVVLKIAEEKFSFPYIIGIPKSVENIDEVAYARWHQPEKYLLFPTKVISTTECDLPSDAEVYSRYSKKTNAFVYYNALLRQYGGSNDTTAIQLLWMQNKLWFRVRIWPNGDNSDYTEIMKEYELSAALELFEYWLSYLTSSWSDDGVTK